MTYFFAPPGIHILIKWTKTLPSKESVKIIKILSLPNSDLCSVLALKAVLRLAPGNSNSPLFQNVHMCHWQPLIDTKVRQNLTLLKLGLFCSDITFHSFQRSGATLGFNSDVDIQDIQSHDTWTSDCVLRCITQDSNASDQVALIFK